MAQIVRVRGLVDLDNELGVNEYCTLLELTILSAPAIHLGPWLPIWQIMPVIPVSYICLSVWYQADPYLAEYPFEHQPCIQHTSNEFLFGLSVFLSCFAYSISTASMTLLIIGI